MINITCNLLINMVILRYHYHFNDLPLICLYDIIYMMFNTLMI